MDLIITALVGAAVLLLGWLKLKKYFWQIRLASRVTMMIVGKVPEANIINELRAEGLSYPEAKEFYQDVRDEISRRT